MWASFVHSWSLGPSHSHLSVVIRAAPLIMSAGWHSTFPSSVFSFQFHLWYWIELLGCCWLQARRQMNTQLSEPLSSKREFLLSLHFVFVQINRLIYIPFPALHTFNLGKTLDSSQQSRSGKSEANDYSLLVSQTWWYLRLTEMPTPGADTGYTWSLHVTMCLIRDIHYRPSCPSVPLTLPRS